MKKSMKGFTLIEIMIVVAIIAILAAVAIPNFITYRKTAQMNSCKANMKTIVAACEAYSMKSGNAASDATSFDNLTATDKGAFLKKKPTCPIGGSGDYSISYQSGIYSVTCPNASADGTDYAHVME